MRARIRACDEAGRGFFVATLGDLPVGYASYGPFRAGEGYARTVEHSVYVDRSARRTGIARALMAALIGHARARGMTRMVAGVSADQPGSLALHRALGFAECGRLPGIGFKHGRSLDLVLLVLPLDRPPQVPAP